MDKQSCWAAVWFGLGGSLASGAMSAGAWSGENRLPLPADLMNRFLETATLIAVRSGAEVVTAEDDSTDVFLIISGRFRSSVLSSVGREVVFNDLEPGFVFGEIAALDGTPRSASVTALEPSKVAVMTAMAFNRFLSEVPGAGLWLARQLAARLRSLSSRTYAMATQSVAGRVCEELLRIIGPTITSNGSDGPLVVRPMPTHSEIATRIGCQREAVSRELGALARAGIVQQSGRTLTVGSIAKLTYVIDRARQ